MTYSFGPYRLDADSRRLLHGERVIPVSGRHVDVLLLLVAAGGQVVSKDALIRAAWNDVAVTDNSLEQAISTLRRALGVPTVGAATYIETLARRGYRFAVPVEITQTRHTDEALAQMLAPYRALVDGRAALETLDRDAIARAAGVFSEISRQAPDYAPAHLGLANALALGFEAQRADCPPDPARLATALRHASEACRLDPSSGEAWATLSLLAHQSRDHVRAVASAQRAAALEPDNWRHQLRLAYVSWGEARLRAAHRVMKLLPGFAFAHWLAATVHVARQAFDRAEDELSAGADAQDQQHADAPFKGVGLHLLLGLVRLTRGNDARAVEELQRELSRDPWRHIYGREACANTWCALAAVHLRRKEAEAAREAFAHALDAVSGHVTALAACAALSPAVESVERRAQLDVRLRQLHAERADVDAAIAEGVYHAVAGDSRRAAAIVFDALSVGEAGSAGWSIPIDPLLNVQADLESWGPVLARVRSAAR